MLVRLRHVVVPARGSLSKEPPSNNKFLTVLEGFIKKQKVARQSGFRAVGRSLPHALVISGGAFFRDKVFLTTLCRVWHDGVLLWPGERRAKGDDQGDCFFVMYSFPTFLESLE